MAYPQNIEKDKSVLEALTELKNELMVVPEIIEKCFQTYHVLSSVLTQ